MIIAVLIALNPPATSKMPMTRVSASPQTMMWWDFFCEASPAAAMVLMINTAESAEVTRNVSSRMTMTTDMPSAKVGGSMTLIVANSCEEMLGVSRI